MKRDLAKLYSELGLQPDCSLEEFNRTYRRRIAELHPDKGMHDASSEAAALPELIWLHATATRFHRRYGRLPGAPPERAHGSAWFQPSTSPHPEPVPSPDPLLAIRALQRDRGADVLPWRSRLIALLLLALLLILALSWT